MSIEGGMKGDQRRLVCPNCGKVFFAWRPDEHPAVKIKCYFCRHEFADEAARRQFQPPPAEPQAEGATSPPPSIAPAGDGTAPPPAPVAPASVEGTAPPPASGEGTDALAATEEPKPPA